MLRIKNIKRRGPLVLGIALMLTFFACQKAEKKDDDTLAQGSALEETKDQKDTRMKWWREARFGLFIHWGLYAIPAGEWKEETNHAEWILTTAQIPVEQYEKFA
jgi:alpha-L-fucosidase